MFYSMDNFEIYDEVKTTGSMDPQWFEGPYTVRGTLGTEGLLIGRWENRVALGANVPTVGQRSVYAPLGSYITPDRPSININQKLLNFTPGDACVGGVSLVTGVQEDHLIGFGFLSNKTGFIRYVNEANQVVEEIFNMPTALTLETDTIEWGFTKTHNNSDLYRPFSIWVNNKPAYLGNIFNQTGSSGALCARIFGGIATQAVGTTVTTKFLNTTDTINVPTYATTDLVINSGQRLGLVRVMSRTPTADTSPNSLIPNIVTNTHAEIVDNVPPNVSEYLVAASAAGEEMYASSAYPDLSSEAVLAVGLRIAASKNNPFAFDLKGMMRLRGQVKELDMFEVDLLPTLSNIMLERNPVDGLPWTAQDVNSLQFGIKVE